MAFFLATYITPFYATSTTNLYGNVQNSPIVRATYTQSINGLEPLALFHKNPTEDDFSAQFLNPLLDPLITRICFDKCYNYQQNQIYINKKFISDSQSVVSCRATFYFTIDMNDLSNKMIPLTNSKNSSMLWWLLGMR